MGLVGGVLSFLYQACKCRKLSFLRTHTQAAQVSILSAARTAREEALEEDLKTI